MHRVTSLSAFVACLAALGFSCSSNGSTTTQASEGGADGTGPENDSGADAGPDVTNGGEGGDALPGADASDSGLDAMEAATDSEPASDGQVDGRSDAATPVLGFAAPVTYSTGSTPQAVHLTDMNGDMLPDIVVANAGDGNVGVFLNRGAAMGTFYAQVTYASGPIHSTRTGDMNGDGFNDVVIAGGDLVAVMFNLANGTGSLAAPATYATPTTGDMLSIGSLTSNGKPDVVFDQLTASNVAVLLNQGNGTLGSASVVATGTWPEGSDLADLTGDGKLDAVIGNIKDNTISVLVGNGDGTFSPQVTYAIGNSPGGISIADLNGDGAPDVAVANQMDDTVSVLLNKHDGNGTLLAQSSYGVGKMLSCTPVLCGADVAIGDVNGDLEPDLIVANAMDGTVSVLLNAGAGILMPHADFAAGAGASSVALADVNGDGRLDVAVTNYSANTVSVLLNTTH